VWHRIMPIKPSWLLVYLASMPGAIHGSAVSPH
jgi:hypothetical protein